jgi:L-alanine-DL-glutamate epimerase-like enolase superfamily enzyme
MSRRDVEITGVETYPVWGGERNYVFVVVDTDEGIHGVGEAGLTGRELAVDLTLWDIKGEALGVPVYELLGGRLRDRVVCFPHNTRFR